MNPLNNNSPGCNPVSSNCVIWQGPDIPCIKLCKGDSVSDTVYKLATELCDVLTTLDINTYDLNCLVSTGCAPADFQGLVQLLIDSICAQNDLDPPQGGTGREALALDTIVPIADCFAYTNEYGDRVTTMTISLYVRTIGNKICDLVNQINSINLLLANHETRIAILESTPPPTFSLAQVTPVCVLPSVPTDIYSMMTSTERALCELLSATGSPNDLFIAMSKQCVNLNNSPVLGPTGGIMAGIPGWETTVTNLAKAVNNIWLTLCDLRSAVSYIQANCCPTGCDGISIGMTSSLTGTNLAIYITGTIPAGFEDCNPAGNLFTIMDTTGGSYSIRINVVNQLNAFGGTIVALGATPLNLASDLTVHSDVCLTNPNTNATCQFCLDYLSRNSAACPALVVTTSTDTTLDYSLSVINVPGTYTVELWNSAGTAVISATTYNPVLAGVITGTFVGLTASTNYRIRVVVDIGGTITNCPFTNVTTVPVVCNPPTSVSGLLDASADCANCGPVLEFSDNATVDGLYADVGSSNILTYSGGSFTDFFEKENGVIVAGGGGSTMIDRGAIDVAGITWAFNSNSYTIEVWSDPAGTPTLDTTITLNDGGNVTPRGLCYDPVDNLVYFTYTSAMTTRGIGVINPNTYTVTYAVNSIGGGGIIEGIWHNPVTYEKYVMVVNAALYIFAQDCTGAALATINTLPWPFVIPDAAQTIDFNTTTGEAYFAQADATGVNELVIVDPVAYTTTYANAGIVGYFPLGGGISGATKVTTYYPGDGTPGSDSIFVIYRNNVGAPNYNWKLVEFNATTLVATEFLDDPSGDNNQRSIIYSRFYNKIVYFRGNDIHTYDPTDGTVNYSSTITAVTGTLRAEEDLLNGLIIAPNGLNGPDDNLVWYGLDETNVTPCPSGIVLFFETSGAYLLGPYKWDNPSLSWVAMVNWTITDGGATFTVTSTFGVPITSAFLTYTVDGGATWLPWDSVFHTSADYALGVTYTKADIVDTSYSLRLSVLTDAGCSVQSDINNDYLIP